MPPPDERLEIDFDDFDEGEPEYDFPPRFVRYRGLPFTGTAVERSKNAETRCDYENGHRHGRYRTVADTGQVLEDSTYERGAPIGESRGYFRDGTLREVERYDAQGKRELCRTYDERGALRYERTLEGGRTWYADGTLRSEDRDGIHAAYARDGRCAYYRHPRPTTRTTVYENFAFQEDVMAAVFLELVEDLSFDYGVWMWIHRHLDEGSTEALSRLRSLLAHRKLSVRATAMRIVGNRGLTELAPELTLLLEDERVPPNEHGEYPGQGGRGHSFSLAKTARLMLKKLRR